MQTIRFFLLGEAASFATMVLVHVGVLAGGYEHRAAGTAESVIGAVLLAGLALTVLYPSRTRPIGVVAQGFALLGTLVGAFTIAIGVGPRTALDLVYHAAILVALTVGLVVAARAGRRPGQIPPGKGETVNHATDRRATEWPEVAL
jgi:hypothetical protein